MLVEHQTHLDSQSTARPYRLDQTVSSSGWLAKLEILFCKRRSFVRIRRKTLAMTLTAPRDLVLHHLDNRTPLLPRAHIVHPQTQCYNQLLETVLHLVVDRVSRIRGNDRRCTKSQPLVALKRPKNSTQLSFQVVFIFQKIASPTPCGTSNKFDGWLRLNQMRGRKRKVGFS